MCDCIKEIKAKFIAQQPVKDKVVTEADLLTQFIMVEEDGLVDIQQRTYTDVELTIQGKVKPFKTKVTHTFCPFCGVKYNTGKEQQDITP